MSREAKILTAIFTVIVGAMIAVFMFAGGGEKESTDSNSPVDTSKLVRENSHKYGNGPVTVVEFGDFQCPACAAAEPTVQRLKDEYKDKITFVYRNYPLPNHKNAISAAEAAEAAGTQGKYWEMNRKLFETQTQWQDLPNPVDQFASYARELGLDADQVKKEINENKHIDFINSDKEDGNSVGVTGTPTFFIDGKKADSFSYDTLKSMIEAAINK